MCGPGTSALTHEALLSVAGATVAMSKENWVPRSPVIVLQLWCERGGHGWARPVGPGAHPKSCADHPRDSNAGPVQIQCETCGGTFTCIRTRATSARFCSVACRDVGRRLDIPCRQCGTPFSVKRSEAPRKLFCSRACLFAARSCSRCSKMVPATRRETGLTTCSERCALGDRLDRMQEAGDPHAWCPDCSKVLPADRFHREAANRNGLSGRCKECTLARYRDNKIEFRRRRFLLQSPRPERFVPFDQAQRDARWAMWGGRCWVCGVAGATEEDHVKPLSAGGSHTLSNLRPICKSCNASKRGSWPLSPERLAPRFRHPNPRPGTDVRTPRLTGRVLHTCQHCGHAQMLAPSVAAGRRYCSAACRNSNVVPPHLQRRLPPQGQPTLFKAARPADAASGARSKPHPQ